MNRGLFSLSPIGGGGGGGGGGGVHNWRSWLLLNRWLFSLSHRMGEGWGEGSWRGGALHLLVALSAKAAPQHLNGRLELVEANRAGDEVDATPGLI